jgi:hypothetical protein
MKMKNARSPDFTRTLITATGFAGARIQLRGQAEITDLVSSMRHLD